MSRISIVMSCSCVGFAMSATRSAWRATACSKRLRTQRALPNFRSRLAVFAAMKASRSRSASAERTYWLFFAFARNISDSSSAV